MAKQTVNRGSSANDGSGDNLRDGANKINLNFDEIYTAIGDGSTVNGTWKLQDDSSTQAVISANGEVLRILGGTSITSTLSGNDLTLALDTSSVLTASGTTTVTNKTINGPDNTLTNIANASLANSSITVSDGSNSTARALGSTLTIQGTSNEVEVAASTGTLTVGLPNDVTISGNLTVQGTQTTINSTTIDVTNSFTFEGTTSDGHETTLTVVDPTADRTVSLPNATGTVVLKDTTDTLTNKSINLANNTVTGTLAQFNTAVSNATLVDTAVSTALDSTTSGNKLRFNFANTGALPTASTYEGMFAYDIGGNNPYVADAGGWVKLITENGSIADLSNVGSIASISNNQVLKWNSSAGRFDPADDTSGIASVAADTTPQLGGDLDTQGNDVQDAGYVSHRSPDATVTQTLTVTVVTKTTEHTAYGDGSSSGYVIDGHEGAHLQLSPGVYKFDQADNSNSGHPLLFYREAAKTTAYTTNVTTSGTPGSSGAHTTITITKDTPSTLHYQCSSHATMGGVVSVVGSESPTIRMKDNDKIHFGDDNDAELYHSGSATILREASSGDLLLAGNGVKITNGAMSENHVNCINNGSVSIYYDNVKKIETTTSGIDVTGEVLADKAYIAEATLTDQATVTWDMNSQSVCKLTLAGSRTMAAPTNGSTGQFASILVIQDGTGSRTLTWNAVYEFASDTAPTLTTTASLGDLFTFRYNGAKWLEVGRNQALTLS